MDELIAVHDPIRRELKDFKERLEYRLAEYLVNGNHIIIESSQGSELDVNMGTIPDQTSSHLLAPYAFPSLGLPRRRFKIYGVEKIYPTRVGNGEMPTLMEEEVEEKLVKNAGEFGATTGRKRRSGYPDWVAIKRAAMINDCDGIYLTRADCIQDLNLKVGTGYYINGQFTAEVPLNLAEIEKVLYQDKTYKWKLWDGQRDLSNASKVDEDLKLIRQQYVEGGFESLPLELREYIADHDKFVGCETIGVSIGPTSGETVRKYN